MQASAKSPKRRATSSKAQPACDFRTGKSISKTISSGSRQFVSAETKKSSAGKSAAARPAPAP